MQVEYKAGVEAPAQHRQMDPGVRVGQIAGQVIAPLVINGWPLLVVFVAYRVGRWFLRVIRRGPAGEGRRV